MTYLLIAIGWCSIYGLTWSLCRISKLNDDLNHLDRPVNVQANRVLYASADAWPDHVLN